MAWTTGTRPSSATASRCRCAPATASPCTPPATSRARPGSTSCASHAATPPAVVPASTSVPSTPACPPSWTSRAAAAARLLGRDRPRRRHGVATGPSFGAHVMATRPRLAQTAWAVLDGDGAVVVAVGVEDGRLVVAAGGVTSGRSGTRPIEAGRWYRVDATISVDPFEIAVSSVAVPESLAGARPPGARHPGRDDDRAGRRAGTARSAGSCSAGARDRVAPRRAPRRALARRRRDAAPLGPVARRCTPGGSSRSAGSVPTASCTSCRPVASPDRDWDGSVQAWTVDPSHYDAVHFHSDDLYDAGWDDRHARRCRPTCRAASTPSGCGRRTARTACRSSCARHSGAPTAAVARSWRRRARTWRTPTTAS